MPAMESPGGRRAVLFARRDLPTPARKRREAVVQELRYLAERGSLDAFDVVEWDKRVAVAGDSTERERYEAFADWADDAGVALSPFFDTRLCYCEGTEKREELVLPALCLALYEDGDLETVAPHADGRHTLSVEDAIDRLAVGAPTDERRIARVPTG